MLGVGGALFQGSPLFIGMAYMCAPTQVSHGVQKENFATFEQICVL
jgi:hypothetical protein